MPAAAFNALRVSFATTSIIVALACSVLMSSAQAAVIATAAVTFPSNLTPGQSGVEASIQIVNQNTGANVALVDTVTSITLIPSCASAATGDCTGANSDPGVFSTSAVGTGEIGTACSGMTFTISQVDAVSGKLQFVSAAPVTLPGADATCKINFTLSVLKVPVKDASGAAAGTQTIQILDATVTSGAATSTPRATSVTTVQLTPQVCGDIDGDGRVDALTDALILIRALFGLTGAAVINGAIGPGATRTTWDEVRVHMNTYCGTSIGP